jgi:hypothetical protein
MSAEVERERMLTELDLRFGSRNVRLQTTPFGVGEVGLAYSSHAR